MLIKKDHRVIDSFVEWFEYTLLKEGQAYKNVSTPLYPMSGQVNGENTFSAPFHQWVFDQSITGANIPTASSLGVDYVDYRNGRVINSTNVAGNVDYSFKEFNIYMTTKPDETLFFENRYQQRPKPINFDEVGLPPNEVIAPCIFIRPEMRNVQPLALGGSITSIFKVNALIYSDSEFKMQAVVSIFMDKLFSYVPILQETPLNYYGDYKTGGYNYEHQLQGYANSNDLLRIKDIFFTPIENDSISKAHPDFHIGRLYFELHDDRK